MATEVLFFLHFLKILANALIKANVQVIFSWLVYYILINTFSKEKPVFPKAGLYLVYKLHPLLASYFCSPYRHTF